MNDRSSLLLPLAIIISVLIVCGAWVYISHLTKWEMVSSNSGFFIYNKHTVEVWRYYRNDDRSEGFTRVFDGVKK